jgi:hypothetical protein
LCSGNFRIIKILQMYRESMCLSTHQHPVSPPHGKFALFGSFFMMKCLKIAGATWVWVLTGCGTMTSSLPVYPSDWPGRMAGVEGPDCPDISGLYAAVSEPAAPMVYPPGGTPKEMFFIGSYSIRHGRSTTATWTSQPGMAFGQPF